MYIVFSTTVNSKNYYIYLYLFGTVIAEKTVHINLEREIKITLIKAHKCKIIIYLFFILFLSFLFIIFIKLIGTEWLRLCIEKERNPLISVDSAHIYKHDWIIDSLKNIGNYKTYNVINIK